MLNKLFRPKWQHENPVIRKAAVEKLNPQDTDILAKLALDDSDSEIRQLAISKIDKLDTLENLADKARNRTEKNLARRCWVSSLIEQMDPAALEEWILDCKNQNQLLGIIAYSNNENLSNLALCGLNNDTQLLTLLECTSNARAWRMIAEKLQSEASLKQALDAIKGRDKKTQQLLKGRLDALRSKAQEKQHREQQAEQLQDKLQRLLQQPHNPQFEGMLLSAQQQWQELQPFNLPQEESINLLLENCQQQLQQQQDTAEPEAINTATEKPNSDTLLYNIQQLLTKLQQWPGDTANIATQLEALEQQWQQLPSTAQNRHIQNQLNDAKSTLASLQYLNHNTAEINALLKNAGNTLPPQDIENTLASLLKIQRTLQWPTEMMPPEQAQAISEAIDHLQQQRSKVQEKARELQTQIRQWIDAADALIEGNNLPAASKKASKIRHALEQLPEQQARHFNAAFQRISNAVKDLADWKDYATDPKREALVEQMQKLIDTELPAQNKADAIKALQDEWKALGFCHNKALWEEFQRLADEAFAPCKSYFAEQQKLREYNAGQRQVICTELENFLQQHQWENSDWKALEKLHRATQDEWQRFSPVDRTQHKPLQDRFYQSLNTLKEKLNEERQRNTDKMQQLINEAEALAAEENVQQAINQYQALHEQWKEIGISFHKRQHQLWQAFKAAGETLYGKRRDHYQAKDDERQQNQQRAEAICTEINKLSEQQSESIAASRERVSQLQQEFQQLQPLPKTAVKPLQQAFEQASQHFRAACQQWQQQQWMQPLRILQQQAEHWQQQELQGQPASSDAELPDDVKTVLEKRQQPGNDENWQQTARLLCIQMEMLAELDSPSEDQELRMQWQMQKLQNSFGHNAPQNDQEAIKALYLQWFALPCRDKEQHAALQKRFLNAAEKALSLSFA